MNVKNFLCILLFFNSNTAKPFSLDTTHDKTQTNKWIKGYLYDGKLLIPEEDLQLIANLCYFSFQRSHLTLKAQARALKTMSSVWNGWQNIAQTRLNPSKIAPHKIAQQEKSSEKFWSLHDAHQNIGAAYAHAVNAIVDTELLKTTKAAKAVSVMRSQARAVVAQALVDVRTLLGNLFQTKKGIVKKGVALFDYLKSYLPQLAVFSFSEANTLNNVVSEDGWSVLFTIQKIGARTWRAIEEARASFYLARYNGLIKVMSKNNLPKKYFEILFDHEGVLLSNDGKKYLPKQGLGL